MSNTIEEVRKWVIGMYSIEDRKREIFREYQMKRERAIREAEDRRDDIYNKYPRLKEINEEMNRIGLSLTKKVLFKGMSKEEAVKECELEMSILEKEKKEVLRINNIPLDYFEPKYDCIECNDSGVLNDGTRCKCYEQQLLEDVYELSNMNVLLSSQNFNNLNMDIYCSEKGEDGVSQKELMEGNIEVAKKFVESITDKQAKSLLLFGPTGSGKTYISSCIAKEVLDNGYTVVYMTISEIIDVAKERTFGEVDKEIDEKYKKINNCDLLIMDDLGTELTNKFVISELYRIVNNRLVNGKKVIISTNLTPQEIYTQYSSRVFYRLAEGYRMVRFIGPNIRVTKL